MTAIELNLWREVAEERDRGVKITMLISHPCVIRAIRSFHLQEPVADVKQDFALLLLSRGFPDSFPSDNGSSFTKWVYTVIRNFLCNKLKEERRERDRRFHLQAHSLGRHSHSPSYDVSLLLDEIETRIAEIEPTSYGPDKIPRSPHKVFTMLREGWTVLEIAEAMGVRRQFVYVLLGKIRESIGVESEVMDHAEC